MELQIKRIMDEKGLSSGWLAEQLGTSTQYVYQLISGKNGATLAQYERIAELLGVHLWQVIAPADEYVTTEEHQRIVAELTKEKQLRDRPDLIVVDRKTGETRNYQLQEP